MKAQTPSHLLIKDGQYAQGKKIHVAYEKASNAAVDTVLRCLEFLARILQVGDKLTLRCRQVYAENGELTICEVSLMRDSNHTYSGTLPRI